MNRAPATVGASRSGGGDQGVQQQSMMDRTRLHLTVTVGMLTLVSAGLLSFLCRTAGPCDPATGNTAYPAPVVGWTCPQALLSGALNDLMKGLGHRIAHGEPHPQAQPAQEEADRQPFGSGDRMASLEDPSGPTW